LDSDEGEHFVTPADMYDFTNRTVVITGGTGVLGRAMALALTGCGANVAVLSRNPAKAADLLEASKKSKGKIRAFATDVVSKDSLENSKKEILQEFGTIDCLINGAGGNHPNATTNPNQSFFQLSEEALRFVSDLNLLGTILPSQVFGNVMAQQKNGVIVNVTSLAAVRPLTRVAMYSAAKSAVSNFTQWLAVHMAQEYSPNIRVNAVAPGFFLTEQNRFLLTDEKTGELTERGRKIIEHTPMKRFGQPEDLVGTVLWLLSPASKFVTGIVVFVVGGFSAYSGV
jgi:NAD(P)-dependent dehydrogenase (short-subunit alcohol dehydrogenase family)